VAAGAARPHRHSPFWRGADTGYASYRGEVWNRWPTAGLPEVFASRATYDALVETLVATGSVREPTELYWDVRPSARQPTLEFRATVARGTGAARQRAELRRTGRLEAVVDLVAEATAR
jgi:gamma-glutamyl:cysteine ligase YbdK (ATP-grasp superfamily)